MTSLAEAFDIATRHHQAGQLADAEKIYRQILQHEPSHPHALHRLGIIALQIGKPEAALDLLQRAIQLNQADAQFFVDLGEAHRLLERPADAIECYAAALRLEPNLVRARVLLGALLRVQGRHEESAVCIRRALQIEPNNSEAITQLGQTLQAQDKLPEAEACYRRVVVAKPGSAAARFNLANCLQAAGDAMQAATVYREAIAIDAGFVDAHNNLGAILKEQGQLNLAAEHYRMAIRLKDDCAAAHANLGAIHYAWSQFHEAEACYRRALQVDPRISIARQNLGSILIKQGRFDEACSCFQELLRTDPQCAGAYAGLGNVMQLQERLSDAIAYYEQVLLITPGDAETYSNMGVAWSERGDRDEGIRCCLKAIELDPSHISAHVNLATSYKGLGRLDEAIVHFRKALELDPASAESHSSLLYSLNYHPAYEPAALFAEHRAWGQRHADPLTAASPPHVLDRALERRLRVGYVSPHFKSHAVNFFSEPILADHDHERFEIFCYSDVELPDETTRRLQGYADQWRAIAWQSDQRVADQIRADRIDILVDLTGHISGGKRLLVFARKPAPIQVTYIGYQNTTGMLAMDYRLTDAYSDPPGTTECWHTETLVRLPNTFFCYLPTSDAPPIVPPPAVAQGHVTFGSINNYAKITPEVLSAWAEILRRVPQSRLLVRADMTPWLTEHLRATFGELGIEPERLELVNRLPRAQYLELINRLDIALDPFPFNGHTTTCDCLWQGVPVVTKSGATYVTRFGGSALATLGLQELIATSTEQYIDIAVQLAGDPQRLQALRETLRRG